MSEATNKAMDEFCRLYKSAIVVFSTGVTAANVAEVISKILAIDGVAAVFLEEAKLGDEHITHHMHKRDREGSS